MTEFSGVRVLIVEDEFTVAMNDRRYAGGARLRDLVLRIAYRAGPRYRGGGRHHVACSTSNVAGTPVFPVAQILRERQIPFLFSTGYGAGSIPDEFSGYEIVGKPFSDSELTRKLSLALKGAQ